jgi:hypothetical protein
MGPPSSAHDGRKCGRRTIGPALRRPGGVGVVVVEDGLGAVDHGRILLCGRARWKKRLRRLMASYNDPFASAVRDCAAAAVSTCRKKALAERQESVSLRHLRLAVTWENGS